MEFHLRKWVSFLTALLAKLNPRKQAPLPGAPAAPRQKTYSAASGYVYRYYYLGRRDPKASDPEPALEYLFNVSADRRTWSAVAVVVEVPAIERWEQLHDRRFSATEQYAIAKIALFQALDERSGPAQLRDPVRVRNADIEGIVEILGL